MDCLTNTCFLCFKNNLEVQSVLVEDTDGIVVNEKLRCFFPEIIDSTPDAYKLSCSECLEKLRISYDFKQSVIRNNTAFRDYFEKLQRHHKSHQQLTHSNPNPTNHTFTRDDTAKKVEKCDEKHDNTSLSIQNENLNLTSTNQDQLDTHDQSCQLTTNENDVFFTKFNSQTEDINLKTENIETEEIHIKDDVDDGCSKESADSNSSSSHSGYNNELTSEEAKKRQYKCSKCPKAFVAPSNLEVHTRIHTGKRSFKCQICQKTFTQSIHLNIHTRTHTGEKPHDCDICHKSFNTKSNLITHKRCHDNVRPYQCFICKKTFTQTGHLTTHMYIHSGQKPYHCNVCLYKCTRSRDLKYHMRTHTGERPYCCKNCGKSYARPSHLKRHLKEHHDEGDT